MAIPLFGRAAALVAALTLGFAAPVLAQNVQGGNKQTGSAKETENGSSQTSVGQRGSQVAPSATPGGSDQPTTAQTGVGPRGTKVAPSTTPGQGGEKQ